jgi:hypothetical protein
MKTLFRILVGLFFLPATVINFSIALYAGFEKHLPDPSWVDSIVPHLPYIIHLYLMFTMALMTIPVGVICVVLMLAAIAGIMWLGTGILFSSAILVFSGRVTWTTIFTSTD